MYLCIFVYTIYIIYRGAEANHYMYGESPNYLPTHPPG